MRDRHGAKSPRNAGNRAEVLDQGIAITGELLVKLLGMKLLPIKVRLLVSSKDLATELGLDWWRDEAGASSRGRTKKRGKPKSTSDESSDRPDRPDRHTRRRRRPGSAARDAPRDGR